MPISSVYIAEGNGCFPSFISSGIDLLNASAVNIYLSTLFLRMDLVLCQPRIHSKYRNNITSVGYVAKNEWHMKGAADDVL